uniref:Uncharacterized protein n=1 Tax=viral metagenome TaxID=1070528 RepID=A0A6M3L0K2_9ZZZZ
MPGAGGSFDTWGSFVRRKFIENPQHVLKSPYIPPAIKATMVPDLLAHQYFKDFLGFLKRNMYTEEKNPAEMTGLAMMGLVGSVPGGPAMGDIASLGMIKRARGAGPAIRELMRKEMRSRQPETLFRGGPASSMPRGKTALDIVIYEKNELGNNITTQLSPNELANISSDRLEWLSPTKTAAAEFGEVNPRLSNYKVVATDPDGGLLVLPEQNLTSKEQEVSKLVDFVARGPWFHGRKTYPKPGESFAGARIGSGNLGEPRGLSLTADVGLLERNFAQTPEKHYRVKDKLLDAHAKLYAKLDEFKTDKDWRIISKLESKLNELASGKPFSRVLPRFEGAPSEKILPAWKGPGTEAAQGVLKESYVEALKRQPKLFEPDPYPGGPAKLWDHWRHDLDQTKLNQDISEILQEKGYKALLYSTARGGYREFELRVLNPKDVTMLDIRKHKDPGIKRLTKGEAVTHRTKPEFLGRQTRRIQTWEKATEQYPASLRDIYKDIDLEKIVLDAERGK